MDQDVNITINFKISDSKINIEHLDRIVKVHLEKLIHDSSLYVNNLSYKISITRENIND